MAPASGLRCEGELQLHTPANKLLTLRGDGSDVLVSAQRTRDLLPLMGVLRSPAVNLAPRLPADVLNSTGLRMRLGVAKHEIATLGGTGNWLGRLLGIPGLRVNVLQALRTL